MAAGRVLLVEDEGVIRLLLAEALEDDGFEVVEAVDGDQAAQVLQTHGVFSVLLTDVRMPGLMDGLHLANYARSLEPALPLVIVSGHAVDLHRRLSELDPPPVFLNKPFRLEEVVAAVRKLVANP